jgi:RNA recognition motif-containing protein
MIIFLKKEVQEMVKTLYVGNLPWTIKKEELASCFAQHGEVIRARVITNRDTGRSRGFGFVEVNDTEAEKFIKAMNGKELNGRVITVNEAKEKVENPKNELFL